MKNLQKKLTEKLLELPTYNLKKYAEDADGKHFYSYLQGQKEWCFIICNS